MSQYTHCSIAWSRDTICEKV